MAQKKILILTASPDDKAKLRADREIKAIGEELDRSKNRGKFKIIPKLAVMPDDLIHVLREEEPEIVHFCGHGKKTGLVFENESGEAQTVATEALARLFERFKDKVKCVLLNACYTDIQAKAINQHIQYVIGMTEGIEDTAAIKFAANFYATLITGRSYKDAYDFACIALDLLGIQDNLLPIFLEKIQPQPIPSQQPLNPPTDLHYKNVINCFKSGIVIPFLGPRINLCYRQQSNQIISDIQLADHLAQNLGMTDSYQEVVGSPCPVCFFDTNTLPPDCPVKKALLEGTTAACPLANEQLAVAKLNLQCLAEYVKLTEGVQNVYQKLHELLERKYTINKLHQFFANLPREMKDRGYPLPYKVLVTTNYDNTLERAFKTAEQAFDLVFYVAEGKEDRGRFQYKPHEQSIRSITSNQQVLSSDRPVILNLYGAVKNENFVVTEGHYINYLVQYKIDQLLPYDLLEILTSGNQIHNIFFLGYSPNDTNLRIIVNRLWGEGEIGRKSWMIHQSKPGGLDKEFWRNRKVDLFEGNLEDYIDKLDEKMKALSAEKSSYKWQRTT
jgi:hypothetical protein